MDIHFKTFEYACMKSTVRITGYPFPPRRGQVATRVMLGLSSLTVFLSMCSSSELVYIFACSNISYIYSKDTSDTTKRKTVIRSNVTVCTLACLSGNGRLNNSSRPATGWQDDGACARPPFRLQGCVMPHVRRSEAEPKWAAHTAVLLFGRSNKNQTSYGSNRRARRLIRSDTSYMGVS